MGFRQFLLENKLTPIVPSPWGDDLYQMDVSQDEFIHFTPAERVQEILKSKMLMFRPPYEKFGSDAVNGISLTFGQYVPGVQTTHIKGDNVSAIWFKTNVVPHRASVEEVDWHVDVPFTQAREVSEADAIKMIKAAPEPIDDMATVIYQSYEDFGKAHQALLKSWGWT